MESGYRQVALTNKRRGVAGIFVTVYHHIAVYLFVNGEYPEGWQIDHKDRNNVNDLPDNLRAVTPADNIKNSNTAKKSDRIKHTIRAEQIADIRFWMKEGLSQSAIAETLMLNRLSVRYIMKKIEAGKQLKYELLSK